MKRKSDTVVVSPINKKRKVIRTVVQKASPFDLSESGRAKYIAFLRKRVMNRRRNAVDE